MADQQDDPKGIQLGHDFYCVIALKAASELRAELKIDETAFRRISPRAWHDPRPAFIYRVLDEVQKAGLCINEWFEKLNDDSTPDPADHETRLTHQWLLDEQNFRARKLTEVLVDLVCFSATNEPEYYRDYLQLRDLDTTVRSLKDQEEFFGFRRRNSEFSADSTARDIIAGEAKLDVSKRWYLEVPRPFQEKWKTGGVKFSSFRQRYIRSLELALPNELALLGKTYGAYAGMSSDIHFTPEGTSWKFDPDAVDLGFNRVADFTLNALSHPLGPAPLAVKIPDFPFMFTVEYRQQDGWDAGIPANAVVLHTYTAGASPYSFLFETKTFEGATLAGQTLTLGNFRVRVNSTGGPNGTANITIGP